MYRSTTRIALAVVGAILAVSVGASTAQSASPGIALITNLDNPRGLAPLPGGDVLVSEAGAGRAWRVDANGTKKALMAGLPVGTTKANGPLETTGLSAAVPDGSGGYRAVVGGAFDALYTANAGGIVSELLDLGAYEEANNTDGKKDANGNPIVDSNPFDVAVDSVGNSYITDAGANAVIRHSSNGVTSSFFVPPQIDNPLYPQQGPTTISQMPTGITIGPDGAIYVATFPAPPYPSNEARVYRLEDKNANGHARDAGESSVYASGLTAATDLAFDSKDRLWVSEYSTNMLTNQPGRISRIVNGLPTPEVHLLTTPTSIAFAEDGRLLVTEQSIGRVGDVTEVDAGGFSSPITTGVNFTTYNGGPVDQLAIEASAAGATAVAVTVNGKMIILIPGAPSFVNSAFKSQFPVSVPSGTIVIVLRP